MHRYSIGHEMSFDEFEQQARLYVVGALEEEEMHTFAAARQEFGLRAERFIDECHKLAAAFALSLRPHPPKPKTKQRLLSLIRATLHDS